MKNHLYLSLVSGAVGMTIGAGSMLAVEAGLIRRHFLHGAPVIESTRELKQEALENQAERKNTRPDVLKGRGY